ncbi:MAG: DUF1858 domain-containing protein [Candidatus Zixiibacteriota bacterium]|nr:MAG: DUF1858 domain-containing protein [candidate division Zixibacteria bacterium]
MKRFVYASLIYLGLAAVFGILDGAFNPGYYAAYAHTHFSLLGFMSMMVFGIGYFILPRFSGSDLRFPSWVPVHFWAANISLIGMVVFRGLTVETGNDIFHVFFIVSATLQVMSLLMFIVNIWISITPSKKQVSVTATAAAPIPARPPGSRTAGITVTADSKVADLVDYLPSLKETLIACGLQPLGMPGHLDHVRTAGVTLGRAAMNHGLDLDTVIEEVERELARSGQWVQTASAETRPVTDGGSILPETLIGEIIKRYPKARPVFQRHFGSACFDCPGQAFESVDMACRMHGIETESLLKEIREAVR